MSIDLGRRPVAAELRPELNALRGNWMWFVLLVVTLLVLGTVALGSVVVASLAAAEAISAILLAESVGAFWFRFWSGFFLGAALGRVVDRRRTPVPEGAGRGLGGPDAALRLLPEMTQGWPVGW